jgi:transcriptional regulator with XRE-family HTH domain
VLTSAQIRCARAALGWSAQDLAEKSGVVRRTIASIEAQSGVPSANSNTLLKIQTALEVAGIEFIGRPDDAPGIRIHAQG